MTKNIVLAVGATEIIKAKGAVHFSNNKVIKALDLGSAVRVSGRSVGSVDVDFKQGSYHIDVLKPEEFRLYSRLVPLLQQMRGLELMVRKNEILALLEILGRLLGYFPAVSLFSKGFYRI